MADPLIILANACAVGYVAPCIALPVTVAIIGLVVVFVLVIVVRGFTG